MKLEYLYQNNKNIKYQMIVYNLFIIFVFIVAAISFCMIDKSHYQDSYNIVIYFIIHYFIVQLIIFNIVLFIFLYLINIYKRKQYNKIKNNGKYIEGIVITAFLSTDPLIRYRFYQKSSGEISVFTDNKSYKIKDIDYNDEFKKLENKLKENYEINKDVVNEIDKKMKERKLSEIQKNKMDLKKINIGIYVLDNKVVADLDSLKIN